MNLGQKFKSLMGTFLTGGVEPEKLSLSVSLGVLWGVFPIVGTCTILCTITALALKLNMAIIQAVNYLVYPVQLVLLFPYFYIGAIFTGFTVNEASVESIAHLNFSLGSLTEISGDLLKIMTNVLIGWVAVVPLVAFSIYWAVRLGLHLSLRKMKDR